jgi:putative colanic acid biosynthesis UDP-glucose lipid carrier transferase
VAGFFDDRCQGRLPRFAPREILGSLQQLADYVKRHRVDVIYSTLPMSPAPRVCALLESLRDTTASIYFVPDVLRFDLIQARVDTVDGMPVIGVCEAPCYGLNALLKRASDVALSAAALVVAAPVLLAIALALKATSRDSVLFKQRRYGLDGREIVVYKFRTMTCTEDGDAVAQATRNDPRTTRLGALLRRYSLDELPQFVNVLQGRMSVVGPRPHAVAHNEAYRKLIRGYMIRHKAKPGITGLAQVRGLRGETDTLDKMRARIECDLEYLRNWSLWLDLTIVLKTVGVVLRRTGAF